MFKDHPGTEMTEADVTEAGATEAGVITAETTGEEIKSAFSDDSKTPNFFRGFFIL
jgi:hypothetical protein